MVDDGWLKPWSIIVILTVLNDGYITSYLRLVDMLYELILADNR